MNRCFQVALLGLAGLCILTAPVTAQDAFVPPHQHPKDRYESGWLKNPFTLKTAPVVEEKQSFAKDLVLHNAYRVMDEVTVVLANTKTQELIRLKNTEPAPNGMKIRSVMIRDARKDSYVEIEMNGESAVLRHDDSFRKQMLASNTTRGNRGAGDDKNKEKVHAGQPTKAPAPGQGPGAGPPAIRASPPSPSPAGIRPGAPRILPQPPRGAPTPSIRRRFTAPPPTAPPTP